MYTLVEIKGKQYKAEVGSLLKVDHINDEPGSVLELNTLMMVSRDGAVSFGAPYIEGAKIKATVGESFRGRKVKVLKFKRRKGYHRLRGHRQSYTLLKVTDIIV